MRMEFTPPDDWFIQYRLFAENDVADHLCKGRYSSLLMTGVIPCKNDHDPQILRKRTLVHES